MAIWRSISLGRVTDTYIGMVFLYHLIDNFSITCWLAQLTMPNMESVGLWASEKRVFMRSSFKIHRPAVSVSEVQSTKATFCSWMSANKGNVLEQRWDILDISE